jgi:hypothetical protein
LNRYKIEYEHGEPDFIFAKNSDAAFEWATEEARLRKTQVKDVKHEEIASTRRFA